MTQRERETERQTERETERQTQTETVRKYVGVLRPVNTSLLTVSLYRPDITTLVDWA